MNSPDPTLKRYARRVIFLGLGRLVFIKQRLFNVGIDFFAILNERRISQRFICHSLKRAPQAHLLNELCAEGKILFSSRRRNSLQLVSLTMPPALYNNSRGGFLRTAGVRALIKDSFDFSISE